MNITTYKFKQLKRIVTLKRQIVLMIFYDAFGLSDMAI